MGNLICRNVLQLGCSSTSAGAATQLSSASCVSCVGLFVYDNGEIAQERLFGRCRFPAFQTVIVATIVVVVVVVVEMHAHLPVSEMEAVLAAFLEVKFHKDTRWVVPVAVKKLMKIIYKAFRNQFYSGSFPPLNRYHL